MAMSLGGSRSDTPRSDVYMARPAFDTCASSFLKSCSCAERWSLSSRRRAWIALSVWGFFSSRDARSASAASRREDGRTCRSNGSGNARGRRFSLGRRSNEKAEWCHVEQ